LSLREVKSTGAKVLVVTLPSAVMAKVATTNGRWRLLFVMKKTSNAQRRTFNSDI
jgi:hypothetical protein